jgi:hypothetical protein
MLPKKCSLPGDKSTSQQPCDTTGDQDVPRDINKKVDQIFENAEDDDESFVVY